jgi:hypothetical protein
MDSEMPLMKDLGMHCFLLVKDMGTDFKYAPITYLDKNDPFFYGRR